MTCWWWLVCTLVCLAVAVAAVSGSGSGSGGGLVVRFVGQSVAFQWNDAPPAKRTRRRTT